MKKFMFALLVTLLLFVSCSKNNPTGPTEKTYRLIVGNPHSNPQGTLTFNIFINEEFVTLIPQDTLIEIGYFSETNSTRFQAFFADSKYQYALHEDTTISTVDCDSILWILCGIFEVYYHK